MIEYRKVTFQELLDLGIDAITVDHYQALSDQVFPLEPDYARYLALDAAGVLANLAAIDSDSGELIGYGIHLIHYHLHYRTSLHSIEDVYYLKPEYRKGMTGVRFLKAQESMLVDLGVQKIIFGTKCRADIGVLLNRLGYTHFEQLYSKVFDQSSNQ